jgi:hypothetical protein
MPIVPIVQGIAVTSPVMALERPMPFTTGRKNVMPWVAVTIAK